MTKRDDNGSQQWRGIIKDIGPTLVAVLAIGATFYTTSRSLQHQSRLAAIESVESVRREAYADFIASLNEPVTLWASAEPTDSAVALANRRILTSFYRLEPLIADPSLRDRVWELVGKYLLDINSLERYEQQGDEVLVERLRLIGAAQDAFREVLLVQLFHLDS